MGTFPSIAWFMLWTSCLRPIPYSIPPPSFLSLHADARSVSVMTDPRIVVPAHIMGGGVVDCQTVTLSSDGIAALWAFRFFHRSATLTDQIGEAALTLIPMPVAQARRFFDDLHISYPKI